MNVLAACGGPDSPVTKVVFKSSAHYYGCERDDPSFFTEDMQRPHPPRTRIESDIVEAEDAVQRVRRAQRQGDGDHAALLQRPRAGRPHEPHRAAEPAGRPRDPRVRPALPVHPRGRHGRRAAPRGRRRRAGRPQRGSGRRARRCRRSPACSASRSRRCSRRGARAWPPHLPIGSGCASRTRSASSSATAAVWTTAGSSSPGYRFALTTRETVQAFAAALRLKPLRESGEAPYRYEREVEEFLRWSPSVHRDESGG